MRIKGRTTEGPRERAAEWENKQEEGDTTDMLNIRVILEIRGENKPDEHRNGKQRKRATQQTKMNRS